MSDENKSKQILLGVTLGVVLLALCIGAGGGWLIFKNKKALENFDIKTKVESTVSTETNSKTVSSYAETKGNTDFQPYMKELQKKVKSNWLPPKSEKNTHVVAKFQIAKDGSLKSVSVLESSSVKEADAAAIAAIKAAAPFEPLPKSFDGDTIDIQFTFDL